MTATMPERLNLSALHDDLQAVLDAHGIACDDLSVLPIVQAGEFAGVTFSGHSYERPAGLPAADNAAVRRDVVGELLARFFPEHAEEAAA
ncbi:hypothetical protein [Actinomadura rudentiformis]|uniref:Uncharacterized protein n=1 Tax=Actinomadura rudentiformis TaxID=359158 RepID=A0A6H9Y9Q3_9ACTN|nr:hypothetical protein [Actinomadura rudentiformis]KAB2341868.1 hypothetical protein F8566_40535 [Actinomadura rudentiformis]